MVMKQSHKKPRATLGYYIWVLLTFVSFAVAVILTVQAIQSISQTEEQAIAKGQRVRIDVATSEIRIKEERDVVDDITSEPLGKTDDVVPDNIEEEEVLSEGEVEEASEESSEAVAEGEEQKPEEEKENTEEESVESDAPSEDTQEAESAEQEHASEAVEADTDTPEPIEEKEEEPEEEKPLEMYGPPPPPQKNEILTRIEGDSRVAVIINNMGLNAELTQAVIRMPSQVALSFSPYVSDLGRWTQETLRESHEILLDLPMETTDYPMVDPGPNALLSHSGKTKNLYRIRSTMSVAENYIGLLPSVDEKLTHSLVSILPLIDEIKKYNVAFIYQERPGNAFLKEEARAIGLPIITHYVLVDKWLNKQAIDDQLSEVEERLERGEDVLIVGRPYPLTIKRLEVWLKQGKARGLNLVPVSQLVQR